MSKAAYALVSLADLASSQRNEVVEDAHLGGHEFGLIICEEVLNGPAKQPLFGYYYGSEGEKKWSKALAAFGVVAAADDEATEQALREQARLATDAQADAIRAAEEANIAAVAGPPAEKPTTNKAKL